MAFTGKATYSAGAALPELAEDVSDIIGIVSPFETPLLDHLGDARREARSTIHEWLEDELVLNYDTIDQASFTPDGATATTFGVDNPDRFRVGDIVREHDAGECMLVTGISGSDLTVVRQYGGSPGSVLANNERIEIVGNAALEGAGELESRFTNRTRKQNYTQIFTSAVEVSGTQLAAGTIGVRDELDYQLQERARELLRDLEATVIAGRAPASTTEGSSTVRRSMNGILAQLSTNVFEPGDGGIPAGGGLDNDELNEAILNESLKQIWDRSSGRVDTIVVNGVQKRFINGFIGDSRGYTASDTVVRDMVSMYESDFGVCRVILSRAMPRDQVLLLDSSRIDVMPMAGRSFMFKRLGSTGDSERGQVIGEYTVEVRNESAHGVITGLGVD